MPLKDNNMTPEEEQKKKRPAEILADTIRTQGEKSEQEIAAANAEASAARQQAITDTQAAQAQAEQDIADVLIGIGNDARRARQENQVIADIEASKAKWAAVTEAAAALSNLVGVGGFNASNQQHKQYSQSWMQEADRQRQQREHRIDDIKSNLDRLKERSAALKQGNATALAKMRVDAVAADAAAKEAAAKREADRELSIATAMAKQAQTDEDAERETENLNARLRSNETVARTQANARVGAATATADAKVETQRIKTEGGSGSGTIKVTIPANNEKGYPQRTLNIKSGSIRPTLAAGINTVTDLTEEEESQLNRDLMLAETAAQVENVALKYLSKSKQLQDLLSASSAGSATTGSPLKSSENQNDKPYRLSSKGTPIIP